MSGWSIAYALMALLLLNVLIVLISLVLAPYHAWRLLRGIGGRVSRLVFPRRPDLQA
ncbi:MAG: hypothetical protein JRH20_20325 [Deltaproteobacteria bacterium]|nr:hypothetical protein [Deltaproteobacteria bacterium]